MAGIGSRRAALAALALAALAAPLTQAAGKKATVTVINKSDWVITNFYWKITSKELLACQAESN